MDKTRRFFWQGSGVKKKYHLVKWEKIISPKKKGDLGVQYIRKINQSLLCRGWWKLEKNEGMWQKVVEKKYVKHHSISQLKYKNSSSSVWNDLFKVKDIYVQGRLIKVGDGEWLTFGRINGVALSL